jgi:aldehyde dehydrogenase (NAD+)
VEPASSVRNGLTGRLPFGGRKGSSYGSHEQGRYASEFYSVVKTA